jgi:hypothetical protein
MVIFIKISLKIVGSRNASAFLALFRTPVRMTRPPTAREALRFSPLVKACGANASSVERVPFVPAGAKPFVFFAGRPAAERAADTRIRRSLALLLVEFAIQNN